MNPLSCGEFLAELAHGSGTERVAAEFESCERSVGASRHFAREQLSFWGLPQSDDLTDRVLLVLSELVTNAVLHGRTRPPGKMETVSVMLTLKRGLALGLIVTDNSRQPPLLGRPALSAHHGRGLFLVQAQSDGWGTSPRCERQEPAGKGVWAYFRCPQLSTPPELMLRSA